MGGKLLKNWELPEYRMNRDEFDLYSNELIDIFNKDLVTKDFDRYRNIIYEKYVAIPIQLKSKTSFGDIDILIGIDDFKDQIWSLNGNTYTTPEYIFKKFQVKPHVNDSVYSFPYKGVQVDICFFPREDFHSALNYMAHSDTSNLMGRIFHKMGLHYGHTGLSFWIRQGMFDNNLTWSDSDHIYEKTVLTRNMQTICKIGDFNYDVWKAGFNTNEESFKFIAASKYFSKDMFAFENLNHTNRVRNKKRTMYSAFVEWCVSSEIPDNYVGTRISKPQYSLIFQDQFPQLKDRVGYWYYQYNLQKTLKEVLNGGMLMNKFNITDGPTIGKIISNIKSKHSTIDILKMTVEELDQIILDTHNHIHE